MDTLMPSVVHREKLVKVLVESYIEVMQGEASPNCYLPEVIRLQVALLDHLCWELLGVSLIALAEGYGVSGEQEDG